MAALEGSRLEEQGKMADAWGWYRAMLRSSRMVGRHGGLVERRFGARMHELAAKRIVRWARDERVDAATLRRALRDSLVADRLTAPISDSLKLEYLVTIRELNAFKFLDREIPLPGGKEGLLEQVVPAGPARHEIQRSGSGQPTTSREAKGCCGFFMRTGWRRWTSRPRNDQRKPRLRDSTFMNSTNRTRAS